MSDSRQRVDISNWTSIHFGEKQKLFRMHYFLFVTRSRSYDIEVQETNTGECEVHAVCTSDQNEAIPSKHAKTVTEGLQAMIQLLEGRKE